MSGWFSGPYTQGVTVEACSPVAEDRKQMMAGVAAGVEDKKDR